jgi:glutamyl-tRNA reductase
MEIVLLGLSHKSAPLEIRESLYIPPESLEAPLRRLVGAADLLEGMILSTCNRTEILGVAESRQQGYQDLTAFLSGEKDFPAEQIDRYCYLHAGRDAVRHIFRVACSLDSMVVGEPQILGQVKEAFAGSRSARTSGPILDQLLRKAFSVAKRVRTDTAIARNPVSISYSAAQLARQIFGDLSNREILLIGSGKMSELAARNLIGTGVREVFVANRTYEKAVDMARRHGGTAIRFDRFFDYLKKVDVVLSSTAAPHWILKKDDIQGLMRHRRNRPIFFIDIAVPRDIDPTINQIDNVYLYDIDDLQSVVDANLETRRQEAQLAEEIIDREIGSFISWLLSRDLSPTIVAFRDRLHTIREREIQRYRKRLGPLSSKQEEVIGEMTAAIVNKILHHPIRWLKRSAGEPGALRSASLVKDLFDIPDLKDPDVEERKEPK